MKCGGGARKWPVASGLPSVLLVLPGPGPYLSIPLSIHPFLHPSISPSLYLSIHLSIHPYTCMLLASPGPGPVRRRVACWRYGRVGLVSHFRLQYSIRNVVSRAGASSTTRPTPSPSPTSATSTTATAERLHTHTHTHTHTLSGYIHIFGVQQVQ